tara:strand:+ start:118 stop:783 length:666 start_codon:yes stop_codon:yes gene_type:complete
MNYLELVNNVLVRLREAEVTAPTDTPYSKLIGTFVNDAKRLVEDSFQWNALTQTIDVPTAPDLFNYVLGNTSGTTGAGQRFRVMDVVHSQSDYFLTPKTSSQMNQLLLNGTPQKGQPTYYNFNGVDINGNTQVDLYPIPDSIQNIFFNLYVPQRDLTDASTILFVPPEPVLKYAYAMAVAERGEDGGISSQEATALADMSLADHIAMAESRQNDQYIWTSV